MLFSEARSITVKTTLSHEQVKTQQQVERMVLRRSATIEVVSRFSGSQGSVHPRAVPGEKWVMSRLPTGGRGLFIVAGPLYFNAQSTGYFLTLFGPLSMRRVGERARRVK